MAIRQQLTIYRDLNQATIESSVKKDTNKARINFDDYTVEHHYDDQYNLKFFISGSQIIEVICPLKDILEVGFGPVTTERFSTEPTHYISINDKKAIDRGDKTLEECVRSHNPTLADFLFQED